MDNRTWDIMKQWCFGNKDVPKLWRSSEVGRHGPGTCCSGTCCSGTCCSGTFCLGMYHHGLFWTMGHYVEAPGLYSWKLEVVAHFLKFIRRKCLHLLKSIWYQDIFEKHAVLYSGLFIVYIKSRFPKLRTKTLNLKGRILHHCSLGGQIWAVCK